MLILVGESDPESFTAICHLEKNRDGWRGSGGGGHFSKNLEKFSISVLTWFYDVSKHSWEIWEKKFGSGGGGSGGGGTFGSGGGGGGDIF